MNPSNKDSDAKRREEDDAADLSRLLSLSDGIFAFAMTLLAINVDLPGLAANLSEGQVVEQVTGLLPRFWVFAGSFLLVAAYWISHRRIFRFIYLSDVRLTWLNIFFLLFVAFLPVPSGLFDSYAEVQVVALLYTGVLLVMGALQLAMWVYATHGYWLVRGEHEPELILQHTVLSLIPVVVFTFAIVVGFINAEAVRYVLIAFVFSYPILSKLAERIAQRISPPRAKTAAYVDSAIKRSDE